MTVATSAPAESIAYPTKRDEAWRYAPHAELGRLVFGPSPDAAIEVPAELEAQIPALDGPRLVVVNGVVDGARSDLIGLPAGVHLTSLAEALAERPGDVEAHFAASSASNGSDDAFVALNRALGKDGVYLRIDEGSEIDRPIHVVDITIPDQGSNATCSGVVIQMAADSSATVVETHLGAGAAFGGSNTRSTIALGPRSALSHIVLQDLPEEQIKLNRVEVQQDTASEYRGRCFNLGASYGRIDYQVRLAGEEAVADLAGLYFGFGRQTLDQQVTVVHAVENCTSRQAFRGVLDDSSTGIFSGGIAVSPGADGTDAEQANDNLLLSKQAEVNTQPRLEILADDVACAHGATVGQLDDDALYYLRSRGIPADESRQLLIAGFADQTVDEIGIEAVQTWIIERLGHGHA